jgi:hypothetical protein
MCGASGEKGLGRKIDWLRGCAGPKDELWFPWTFGSQALNRDFSALIRLAGNVGPRKVRAATSETA